MSGETIFAIVFVSGLLAVVGLNAYLWPGNGKPAPETPDASFHEPPTRQQRRAAPPAKPMAILDIEYADADGVVTNRRISVIQIDVTLDADGTFYPDRIRAYCHLRRGDRTFIIERIEKLFPWGEEHPLRRQAEVYAWFADLCARVANSNKGEVTQK